MARRTTTIPPNYFTEMYEGDPDPWRFATSDYERDKYAATLAALPRERYACALEVGSSIGVFTRLLAPRCALLIGIDPAPVALASARRLNRDQPQVSFVQGSVPQDYPAGQYDLVMISEVAYYLTAEDVKRLVFQVGMSLDIRAHVVLVHWTGVSDYPLTGDQAAELFIQASAPFCSVLQQSRTDKYRLDVLERTDRPWYPEGSF
jgi:hypothetical protein